MFKQLRHIHDLTAVSKGKQANYTPSPGQIRSQKYVYPSEMVDEVREMLIRNKIYYIP